VVDPPDGVQDDPGNDDGRLAQDVARRPEEARQLLGSTAKRIVAEWALRHRVEASARSGRSRSLRSSLSSVIVNNLPAATLLSAQKPPHPLPLLIGLNLGPNLLFTGSLSTYLWYQAARATGVRPSLRLSFLLVLVLVPLTMATALGVLALTQPQAF
jgi:hypothetical protein